MKITRIIAGISLLGASAWLAPMVSDLAGRDVLFGFVTVSAGICFLAGFVFRWGLEGRR